MGVRGVYTESFIYLPKKYLYTLDERCNRGKKKMMTTLLSASENEKAQLLGRFTSIAINPLMVVFLCIVAVKVVEVL
jgi:hypothetical protein